MTLIQKGLAVVVILLFLSSPLLPMIPAETYDAPQKEMHDEYLSRSYYNWYTSFESTGDDAAALTSPMQVTDLLAPWAGNENRMLASNGGLIDSAWPMFCHDIRHTGRSQYDPEGNFYLYEKWKLRLYSFVTFSSPSIANNETIYIGTWAGALHAVSANGTEQWMFKTPDWNAKMTAPAIDENGIIYIGSYDSHLYAINPNGTLQWALPLNGRIISSPSIAEDGTIFIGANKLMCAVHPNGTLLWQYATGAAIKASPAIGCDGTVYVASHDGYFYAFYPLNGTVKWMVKVASGSSCYSSPAIDDNGTIYYGTRYNLYAIAPNGTILWKREGGCYGGPVIGHDGTIYACGGERLIAFAPDGTAKWQVDLGSDWSSPVILKNGMILVFGKGELFCVNPEGRVVQRLAVTATVPIKGVSILSSSSVGTDGTVYVGSWFRDKQGESFGYLHAFGMAPDEPPSEPTITGPAQGRIWRLHKYVVSATDPDGDNISYFIDWGDGFTTGWFGPYDSGQEVTRWHAWIKKGTYTVMVMARDGHGLQSDWTTLPVTMPYSPLRFPLLTWLLERFPNAFPILRHLIGFLKNIAE